MPQISNIGGSLTSAVVLTLLAWGVRLLRATAQRSQDGSRRGGSNDLTNTLPRFFSGLSPAALRMLVELDAIPHVLIHVKATEESPPPQLPAELSSAVSISEEQLGKALSGRERSWPARVGGPPQPTKGHLLVLLPEEDEVPRAAATVAAASGFRHVVYLSGGLKSFPTSAQAQADLRYINRDAVALLIGGTGGGSGGATLVGAAGDPSQQAPDGGAVLIDTRRHDERTLYGSIPGAHHVPVDELPAALQLSAAAWQDKYRFPKPGAASRLIMQCRTNRRASWAAQLAADAGLPHVFVYKQGVYGWRLDPNVKSYRSYEKWDAPPEPEPFQMESINVAAAREELEQLGLLPSRQPSGVNR